MNFFLTVTSLILNQRLPCPISVAVVTWHVMPDWLSDSEVKQSYPNASREQHGEVRCVPEFWFSSGLPSFTLAYFEKYRTTIKMAQTSWVPMYSQVHFSVTQRFHLVNSSLAASGCHMHHATKPQIKSPERTVTIGLKRTFRRPRLAETVAPIFAIENRFKRCFF